MPLARNTERRDTAFAMSPKYSLSLVLRNGLGAGVPALESACHMLPLGLSVMGDEEVQRHKRHGLVPSDMNTGRGLAAERAEIYVSLAFSWEAIR